MLANFKKFGVAAAVATALGASGAAQAVILGQPGDALLIPYVWSTGLGHVNTMISIINAGTGLVNPASFNTLNTAEKVCEGTMHWYFFDIESTEVANDTIDVTCEDWIGIDWAATIYGEGENWRPDAQGVKGYMVITDAAADPVTPSSLILYGTAFQIRGNWATQAFIPVLPLLDDATGTEVEHANFGGFLNGVNPITAGMALPSAEGEVSVFSLRYYLQTTEPEGSTEFVLWFPENNLDRAPQPIVVFDPDENGSSAITSIPFELNVLQVSPDANAETAEAGGYTDWINASLDPVTGFVVFSVNDWFGSPLITRAGIAFSLIGVAGANAIQVQTELAHERGIFTP